MMRRIWVFGGVREGLLAIGLVVALSGGANASVFGGPHDLTHNAGGSAFEFTTFQTCVFCHTPHGANNSASGLLWNRTVLTGTFRVYENTITDTLDIAPGQPGTVSLLCLSCHDGVQAMNTMFNSPNDMWDFSPVDGLPDALDLSSIGQSSQPAIIQLNIGCGGACGSDGLELRDDHPIGMSYESAYNAEVASGANGLHPTATVTASGEIRLFGPAEDRLECSTCHDPHLDNNVGTPSNSFLVMTMDGSQLCLKCHDK